MSKTILIPTDFTAESLNSVRLVLDEAQNSKLNILLVCPMYLPDSPVDLLFFEPRRRLSELMSPEFRDGLSILKNRYSESLESINIRFFHGFNRQAFLNFVDAHDVTEIIVPAVYDLKKVKNGFDLLPYIKQSESPVREMLWEPVGSGSNTPLLRILGI